jgi:hypothetical protein
MRDTEGHGPPLPQGRQGLPGRRRDRRRRAHPDWSPGHDRLQGRGRPVELRSDAGGRALLPAAHRRGAAILTAWTGPPTGSSDERTVIKPYQFTRGLPGKRETSWEALQRLAGEVGWRCFVVGGVVYFISEEQLFMSRARAEISLDTPGLISLTRRLGRRQDDRRQVTDRRRRPVGSFPPGSIIALRDLGPSTAAGSSTRSTARPVRPGDRDHAHQADRAQARARADTIQVPRDVTDDAKKQVTPRTPRPSTSPT